MQLVDVDELADPNVAPHPHPPQPVQLGPEGVTPGSHVGDLHQESIEQMMSHGDRSSFLCIMHRSLFPCAVRREPCTGFHSPTPCALNPVPCAVLQFNFSPSSRMFVSVNCEDLTPLFFLDGSDVFFRNG
jgi:hypothetical protein